MYNLNEQFFADEFNRICQRQRREKQYRNLELKEKIERELAALQEEENQKKLWWRVSFLRKLYKAKSKAAENFQKNKRSDNLASQVVLSNVEYIAPAAAAGAIGRGVAGGAGRAAAGAGRGAASGGASAAEAGQPASFGNFGRTINRLGGMQRLMPSEESDEEGQEEPETVEDFDKVRSANRLAEAAKSNEQKKLQHERTLAQMQKIAQRIRQIKIALRAVKIGSALLGMATLGGTLLFIILIWIVQLVGHYLLGIKVIPGFDWLDYLLMVVVVLLIAIVVLPIIYFMSMLCKLDIFGLVC
jgi:hypothetical protein